MSTFAVIAIFVVIFLIIPAGRRVLSFFFGIIYIGTTHLFMWLQKINNTMKDKDPLVYFLSCLIIYPLFAILILFHKLYDTFTKGMH